MRSARTMGGRLAFCATLLAVMLVAGCKSGAGTSTPTATASPSASAGTSTATGTPTVTIAPGLALTGDACKDWPLVHQRSVVAFTGTGEQLRRSMPLFLQDIAKFQPTVPAAQRADVDVFAQAWNGVAQELARDNYDLVKIATDPPTQAALQATGTAAVVQAMTRLDTWSQTTCGTATATPLPRGQ